MARSGVSWLRSVSVPGPVRVGLGWGGTRNRMTMAVAQVGIGQQLVKDLRAQVTLLATDP